MADRRIFHHTDVVQYDPFHPGQTSTNIWLFIGGNSGRGALVTTLLWARVCGWSDLDDLSVRPCFQGRQRHHTTVSCRLSQKRPPLRNFAPLQPLSLHAEVENQENRV